MALFFNSIQLHTIAKVGAIIVLLIISFVLGRITAQPQTPANQQVEAPVVNASKKINKSFSINTPQQTTHEKKLTFTIESADIQDAIITKGQIARAVKGRAFLIFNLKLNNQTDQSIQLNTRDYIRISSDLKEWLAPDIHNDPVIVQAISTKQTRVAFPIDKKNKQFKLQYGEINGEKTNADVRF